MKRLFLIFSIAISKIIPAQDILTDPAFISFPKNTLCFNAGTFLKPFSYSQYGNSAEIKGIYCVNIGYKNTNENYSCRLFLQAEKQQINAPFSSGTMNVFNRVEIPRPDNELLIVSGTSVESPEITYYNGIMAGYEMHKRIKKWKIFFGADAFLGYLKSGKKYEIRQGWEVYAVNPATSERDFKEDSWGVVNINTEVEDQSIRGGLAPFAGAEYYFNNHLSLFMQVELAFSMLLHHERNIHRSALYYRDISEIYDESIMDNQLSAGKDVLKTYLVRPSLLGLNVHF